MWENGATSRRYAGVRGITWYMRWKWRWHRHDKKKVIETVSINSVYLNRNQLLTTAQIEMQVGKTTLEVPYKVDTSSEAT